MHDNNEQITEVPVENTQTPVVTTGHVWYKKRLLYVLLVATVVAVVVTVYVLNLALSQANKKSTDDLSASTYFKSPALLVDSAKTAATGQVLQTVISNGLGGKTLDGYGTYGVPAYRVGDRDYVNLPTQSHGTGYKGDADAETANYNAFVNFFKKNKFKLVSSGQDKAGPLSYSDNLVNYIDYATYESKNMLCMIWHADATSTEIGNHVSSIGCAEKSDYEKAAKELDPFFVAYKTGYSKSTKDLTLGFPYVEDGASGYKHAVLFVQDPTLLEGQQSEGLFYKSANDKDWRFFINARGVLNCTDYNTDVLKKAFTNLPCYDGSVQKTVAA